MQNHSNHPNYNEMFSRSYEATAMQRAAASSAGMNGYFMPPNIQDHYLPIQVPIKKRTPPMYLGAPPMNHQNPLQTPLPVMNRNLPSRKRLGSCESSLTPVLDQQANKKLRVGAEEFKEESASVITTPERKNSRSNSIKISSSNVGLTSYAADDVLSGRGGGTNSHPGNRHFRQLINMHRDRYLRAKKNDKPHISRSIVHMIRSKKGRFLKKEEEDGLWYEIGDDLAREKTSQALRQKAPEHRRIMEEQDQRAREMNFAVMTQQQPIPLENQIMERRMEMLDIPLPPLDPLQGPPNDDLMLQYIALKRRQAKLQRQIYLVNEIKQMKEQQMLMY